MNSIFVSFFSLFLMFRFEQNNRLRLCHHSLPSQSVQFNTIWYSFSSMSNTQINRMAKSTLVVGTNSPRSSHLSLNATNEQTADVLSPTQPDEMSMKYRHEMMDIHRGGRSIEERLIHSLHRCTKPEKKTKKKEITYIIRIEC